MGCSTMSGFLSLPRFSVIGHSWNQSQDNIHRSHQTEYVEDVSKEIVKGNPLILLKRSGLNW
jgi:hypothetical protein